MKHYILWLRSGDTIEGDTDDETVKHLLRNRGTKENFIFSDSDGETSIDLSQVIACAANKPDDMKKVKGFSR